jgi:hypothetical protein
MRTEKHKYIILPNTNNTKPFCGRRPIDSRAAHAHMQDDSNSPPQEPRGKYWTENLARQAHIQTTLRDIPLKAWKQKLWSSMITTS